MDKIFKVIVNEDDWRFDFKFSNLYVSSYEEWKKKVAQDVYNNKNYYYNEFMENEYYENSEIDSDFDKWVNFHIDFDSYCEEVEKVF